MEHMLRASLLALRIASAAGVDAAGQGRIFYANLLAWIGCHADSFELAALFTDDIRFRADYYVRDQHGLSMYSGMYSHTGAGRPPLARVAQWMRFTATGNEAVRNLISSHCISAGVLATRVGLDDGMAGLLAHTFERWDGKGLPEGRSGPTIPLEMRITHLADTAEVFLRRGGVSAAVAMVRARRGSQFDPALAELFIEHAVALTEGLLEIDCWQAALEVAPDDGTLSGVELDSGACRLPPRTPWRLRISTRDRRRGAGYQAAPPGGRRLVLCLPRAPAAAARAHCGRGGCQTAPGSLGRPPQRGSGRCRAGRGWPSASPSGVTSCRAYTPGSGDPASAVQRHEPGRDSRRSVSGP